LLFAAKSSVIEANSGTGMSICPEELGLNSKKPAFQPASRHLDAILITIGANIRQMVRITLLF
jgi:hypothetical protein